MAKEESEWQSEIDALTTQLTTAQTELTNLRQELKDAKGKPDLSAELKDAIAAQAAALEAIRAELKALQSSPPNPSPPPKSGAEGDAPKDRKQNDPPADPPKVKKSLADQKGWL